MNLIIGHGGTGGNVIRNLKYKFDLYRSEESVRYFYLDTLSIEKVKEDEKESEKASGSVIRTRFPIERSEYLQMKGGDLKELLQDLSKGASNGNGAYDWVRAKMFLNQFRVSDKVLSFDSGAGQFRQIGRLAVCQNLKGIRDKFNDALNQVRGGEELNVFIACSLVGGTGSGGFLDLAIILRDLVRSRQGLKVHIFLFLVLEAAFEDVTGTGHENRHTPERAYAVLRELHRLLQAYTTESPLSVQYADRRAVVAQSLFDGVFLIDMPAMGEVFGEKLRSGGLYPAVADVIELFTEKHTGKKLDEDVVNINSRIRRWQNKQTMQKDDMDMAAMAAKDLDTIKDRLPDFEPFFSTFAGSRIMFPKRRFMRLTALKLALNFLEDLFKPDENRLLSNMFYPDGKNEGKSEFTVMETIHNDASSFLFGWNGLLGQSFFLKDYRLKDWDDERRKTFMGQGSADPGQIIQICAPKDMMADAKSLVNENFSQLKSMCSNNESERYNVSTAVKKQKENYHGPVESAVNGDSGLIHSKMRKYRDAWVEAFETNLKALMLSVLNPRNPAERRGRLGYLQALIEVLITEYLNEMAGLLEKRQKEITRQWDVDQGSVTGALAKINEGSKGGFLGIGATLKAAQEDYLDKEAQFLKTTQRAIANRYLTELLVEAKKKAEKWLNECRRWAKQIVTQEYCARDMIVSERSAIQAELRQLAQSPNIHFGLPSEMGSDPLNPDISMGGYDTYLEDGIDFDRTVSIWLDTLEWHFGSADDLRLKVFSPATDLEHGKAFLETICRKGADDCRAEIGEKDIFDYLVNFLPNRPENPIPVDTSAKMLAEHFHSRQSLLDYDSEYSFTSYYLFFKNPHNPQASQLVDGIEANLKELTAGVGSIELLKEYESSEVLGFIKLDYGIVAGACKTTKNYGEMYFTSMKNRDIMLDIYHIFPEEQNAVDYEKSVVVPKGKMNSLADIIPNHLLPIFADLDLMKLFFDMWALNLVGRKALEQGPSPEFFYLWIGDIKTTPDLFDFTDNRACFHLCETLQLFDAMKCFVNKGGNTLKTATIVQLPPLEHLKKIKGTMLDFLVSKLNEQGKQDLQHAKVLHRLLEVRLKEIDDGGHDEYFKIAEVSQEIENCFKHHFRQLFERRIREVEKTKMELESQGGSILDHLKDL